jgi:tetratricopeptide (TPR) repeat protein
LLVFAGVVGYSVWRSNQELTARQAREKVARARETVLPMVDPRAPDGQLREARARALEALAPYGLPADAGWLDGPNVRRLPVDAVERLREDVAFLLDSTAEAVGTLAMREPDPAVRARLIEEALLLNERAGRAYPTDEPVRLVVEQRQRFLDQSGRPEEARGLDPDLERSIPPRLDEFLKAVAARQAGRNRDAAAALERLTGAGPANAAVWWELGTARLRLGQYERAADAFLVAGAIASEEPRPLFWRGIALLHAGRFEPAIESLDRFLARVDTEPDAWLNRAIAHLRLNKWEAALKDLEQAEQHDGAPARLHALRELAWRQAGKQVKAAEEHRLATASTPRGVDDWTVRGEARLADDPAGAVADFDHALADEPEYAPALRGKASALSERLNRPADAAQVLDRLLATDAATVEDRAGYAVLLARLGRVDEARSRARACLGANTSAVPLYQAASALSIVAKSDADRQEVLAVLRRVLRADPTWGREMPGDPDLKAVHNEPGFRTLTDAAGVLTGPAR